MLRKNVVTWLLEIQDVDLITFKVVKDIVFKTSSNHHYVSDKFFRIVNQSINHKSLTLLKQIREMINDVPTTEIAKGLVFLKSHMLKVATFDLDYH
ncbi:MAG TPA: hypothetical protein VEH06_16550 [Candidatus Bathyarchaeia archaeon]|nr:hypothetical protein [Candidatus Bathyarchaeia archaeon]